MSLLLRTIEAFPRGRTTEQLHALLDVAFDPAKREAILRELSDLQAKGAVSLGRDGRWRPAKGARPRITPSPETVASGGPEEDGEQILRAAPVSFGRETPDVSPAADATPSETGTPDPRALLRYYRSALQSDPRGALTQSPDRHGAAFQLLAGEGSPFPPEDGAAVLRLRLDDLPGDLREALIRREGEEKAPTC